MIDDYGVRPEGCICEPRSDISLNCMDIRSKFGYTLLSVRFWRGKMIKTINRGLYCFIGM